MIEWAPVEHRAPAHAIWGRYEVEGIRPVATREEATHVLVMDGVFLTWPNGPFDQNYSHQCSGGPPAGFGDFYHCEACYQKFEFQGEEGHSRSRLCGGCARKLGQCGDCRAQIDLPKGTFGS